MRTMQGLRTYLSFGLLAVLLGARTVAADEPGATDAFRAEKILELADRVNTYTLEHPYIKTDRNWIRATWYSGVVEVYNGTGDAKYLEQAKRWAEKHQYRIGLESTGFNRLFCSMVWLELNLIEPDAKKIAPTIDGLKDAIPSAPAVGKVWYGHGPHHTDIYYVYADGLFSASTFVMLYQATGDRKYMDILDDAFWTVTGKILDQDEGLYYRDPSFIGKKSPNGGKILWSRGNGWVFSGLAKTLKHLPKDDPSYGRYLNLYRTLAKSLASRQQDDGFWRANLDDSQHYTMPESSGTAFFVDGFGWGIRAGVLDQDTYLPVVIRGWKALVSAVHPDGMLGWVQPVDGMPRPSHPRTTQEYGTGLFLGAASQVYQLVKTGVITPEKIKAASPAQTQMLPPAALKKGALTNREHPLSKQINAFLANQQTQAIASTDLKKNDYLDVITGQVKAMLQYQDASGRMIDPVAKKEMYFTTPCYAHSVAVLAKAGYPIEPKLIESGMKALDVSLADLAAGQAPGSHGDFFTWPLVFACELFDATASSERKEKWRQLLGQIDPARAYSAYKKPVEPSDHRGFYKTYGPHFSNNWNLVNTAGEFGRGQHGFADPWYVDYCMTMQLSNFTPLGMYNEGGNPLPYDLFARHYLTGMLQRGYNSFLHTTYRDILWRGSWTSLFMQSPFGELPTGYRSSQHIWNEAEQAVIFEIYASAYAKEGKTAQAGAFKRAAHLSLASIKNWIRPDGSGCIVKNRYPIEAKHGYEGYSEHTCYNMLAMSMLAQAWQFADDAIAEQPAPADVGGFAFAVPGFHKVFANAGGTYIEYDTDGDQLYNPTGLLRIHLKNGHPQLGPSDGCAEKYSGKGNCFAVGPAWKDAAGNWTKLAELTGTSPVFEILETSTNQVRFKLTYVIEDKIPGTRVDPTPENTVAVNGTSPWFSAGSAVPGKWNLRTEKGNQLYEVRDARGTYSGCELKTTLKGLAPGQSYAVSVLNGLRENEGWQVLCGLTPNKVDAVLSRGMTNLTATVNRKSFFHPIIHEGLKRIGSARADAKGTIDVYTFIPDDVSAAKRCWLAGFTYELANAGKNGVEDKPMEVTENFTLKSNEVLIENTVSGSEVEQLRVYYPMLIADGRSETDIHMKGNSVRLKLDGKGVCFEILQPAGVELKRTGQKLSHRNGDIERATATTEQKGITYVIRAR